MKRRDFLKAAFMSVAAVSLWASPFSFRPSISKRGVRGNCPPLDERCLKLMAVGDIMMHLPVSKSALQGDGSYDFRPHFQYVRPIFQNYDLVIGNLETPLAGGRLSGYPSFNGPDELLDGLKWAGFSALTLANNHSLDQGWSGLHRTAELAGENGFVYVGAYLSAEDRATHRLVTISGVTVGLLGYTYGVNGPLNYPNGERWRLNLMDKDVMLDDIRKLREAGADFIVINIHFGDEYRRVPNKMQTGLVEALFQGGADVIIGHHPHVVQPGITRYGDKGRQAAVFSLGNFISNQKDRYTDQGLMADITLGFDSGGHKVAGPLTLRQTRCIRRVVDGRPTYRVVPVHEAAMTPEVYGLTSEEGEFLGRDNAEMSSHLLEY